MIMRNIAATVAALGVTALVANDVQAQEPPRTDVPESEATSPDATLEGASVHLIVDGMSCPFCAYGLEKRLKDVPAVDALLIRVSDGLVQIRVKDGQSLEDEALDEAVEKAGFTLREIRRIDR